MMGITSMINFHFFVPETVKEPDKTLISSP